MEPSIKIAIKGIHSTNVGDEQQLRKVLLQFYRNRSVEILVHIEEQGLMLADEDIKIGGTG